MGMPIDHLEAASTTELDQKGLLRRRRRIKVRDEAATGGNNGEAKAIGMLVATRNTARDRRATGKESEVEAVLSTLATRTRAPCQSFIAGTHRMNVRPERAPIRQRRRAERAGLAPRTRQMLDPRWRPCSGWACT